MEVFDFECYETGCPVFSFENGPYPISETRVKRISETFGCPRERVRFCASTLPDGTHPDAAKNTESYMETKN